MNVMYAGDNANYYVRSRSKPTWRGTPPGTSVQLVEENPANPQQLQSFMNSLSDVGGVIYGGAGPWKSFDDKCQDVLQQWRTTMYELQVLTDVLKVKKPAFFLAISSMRKEYAPVNSVSAAVFNSIPGPQTQTHFYSISRALFHNHDHTEYLQV